MATTTSAAFNEFHEQIYPGSGLRKKVRERHLAVEAALRTAFPPGGDMVFRESWLVGSLGRATASLPIDDMDILAHIFVDNDLWDSRYARDSTDFLYRVRRKLNSESAVRKIGARGQAVRLFYADGLTVDVAAVEKYASGGFAIPDGSGGWLTTNPLEHAAYLERRDSELEGDLKRFIRILKQWNRAHSNYFNSFHLEALAAGFFTRLDNDRRDALRVFFRGLTSFSVQDPANYSGDLSSYMTAIATIGAKINVQNAAQQAGKAKQAELAGNHREAIRLWRIILGNDFPSYG